MRYRKELIETMILSALNELYDNDSYLISNKPEDWENTYDCAEENHVGERAIVFRYAHYLQNIINSSSSRYLKSLHLDCEYNRRFYNSKVLPSFKNGVYPDLIIHKRGSNKNNLLVMEFKTWWNSNTSSDETKLEEFTAHKKPQATIDLNYYYEYSFGVSVVLRPNKDECNIKWFVDGEAIDNE